MKHVLLSLLLALATLGSATAQRLAGPTTQAAAAGIGGPTAPPEYEAPTTAFADSLNRVFAALDKNRIPSGILEEYGLPFLDHAPFTGTNGHVVLRPTPAT